MRVRYRLVTYTTSPAADQQDMERLFHELWNVRQRTMLPAGEWRPQTDVYETPEHLIVKMELAGVPEDAIEITLYADHVVVTGTREESFPSEEPGGRADRRLAFHEAQIHYGPFRSEVRLPKPVDSERVSATLESGFLVISLPRAGA
ncbi:MAG: Hsp20/alpha crystallin family protein [Chloroflexi bacterium]|nr:Hsp20/alpha crystallin family protein [Chloroflexota bacterium]MDB5074775.1 Hsp20/alpha crystallin family protein [Chloroflexota bacterium]